jgi:hypothetical protein
MPWRSELAQFPTPTMAILILFIAGKTPSYPLPRDWGKKVVTILPYLIGAILKTKPQKNAELHVPGPSKAPGPRDFD